MSDTLLRLDEVKRRVGLGKSAIYDAMAKHLFPQPVKLFGNSSRWIEAEIQKWIDCLKAARSGDQSGDCNSWS